MNENENAEMLLLKSLTPLMRQLHLLFAQRARLTLIARMPGDDDADVLMTSDDLDEVAKVIERRKSTIQELKEKT